MKIEKILFSNFATFESDHLFELSPRLNIFIGANNSGKSNILRAIRLLQDPPPDFWPKFLRRGAKEGSVDITLSGMIHQSWAPQPLPVDLGEQRIYFKGGLNAQNSVINTFTYNETTTHLGIPNTEPDNLLYIFSPARRSATPTQTLNTSIARELRTDFQNLYARLQPFTQTGYPAHEHFQELCQRILGFQLATILSDSGSKAGLYTDTYNSISIEEMGEGVRNILCFLTILLTAENKIFLIEELENDLHPTALKILLDLIVAAAGKNQFFLTTHSHIVLTHLGAEKEARIMQTSVSYKERKPTTKLEVIDSVQERIRVLSELGYDVADFNLFKYYVLCEESSAEALIREILLPEFFPDEAGFTRTIAAQGTSDIEPRFFDFQRLLVYLHTSPVYTHKALVIADGDASGLQAIAQLKRKFPSWPSGSFETLSKTMIEDCYPAQYSAKVDAIKNTADRKKRQELKGTLIKEIVADYGKDKAKVRSALESSAKEVIELLRSFFTRVKIQPPPTSS